MSFDPITYAAANAAKLPLGTFVEAFPGDVPTGDWVHLDGTLISKAAYPKAADILGETILFNATPTETTVSLTLPADVSILRFNATEGLSLSIGDALLFATYQSGSGGNIYRLWRSGDNGGTWVSVDLTLPTTTSTVSPLLLEWFGAGRAVLILRTNSSNNLIVTTTSDYGQTWTAPRSICSYTNSNVVVQLSSDAGLPLDGGGYYYFSVTDGSAYNLYALNSSNNITSPLSLGAEYTLIGGRIITSGTSEVHVVDSYGNVRKTTYNGSSFSDLASSGITTNTTLRYTGTRRIGLTASATGDYFIPGNGRVFKLPANWSGAAVSVLYGLTGVNIPQRLLSNTLVNIYTRAWFNLNTGVETLLPGLNAGPGSVIDQNTPYSRFGHTEQVVSYLGNVFGANQSVDLIQYSVGSPNPVLVLFSRRSMFEFFLAAHSKSLQRDSFAPYSNLVANHYIASTRQLRTVSVVGTSAPFSLSVKTYNQANDYSQYLHLPYLPGLCCKLR